MPYPDRGSTLFIPGTGPAHDRGKGHLFVVLTGMGPDGGILLVPVSSAYENCDRTCVLEPGDHDFIRRESFILYAKMRIYSSAHVANQMASGAIEEREALRDDVFQRVCAGIAASRFSPPVCKRYYERQIAARGPVERKS